MYKKFGKRLMDIILSGIGLIILAIPMLIIAILIKCESPGPVLFKQKRVGIHKTHFEILKFRTMRTDAPKEMPTHLLKNPDMYITRIGKFLRKYSLDEIMQVWQCLTGELSLIGPRPALWNQYDLIEERDKYGANDIKPGITGLAQISGRDELEIDVKARYDGEYAKNITFLGDMKILFKTATSVLCHDGVVEGGTGEMNKEKELTTK